MVVLGGVRVVDFTAAGAGPFGTMLLSDIGAEVVKVEPPAGDHSRTWGNWSVDGKSTSFLAKNRNKRSVVVDLRTAEGRENAQRLIATADVVVESFAPGGAEKLGVGYDACKATRNDIIYCSLSGFGRTGPRSHELGMDMMLQAYCGIMSFTGEPDRPPVRIPVSAIDLMTGAMAFGGILAALRERDRSGQGQWMEVSLYDTAMALLGWAVPTYSVTKQQPKKLGGEFEHLFPYGVFTAQDGYFYLGIATPAHWQRFCDVLGLDHLRDDPRFATNAERVNHRDELRPILADLFATRTIDALVAEMKPAGVPIEKIRDVGEAIGDEHAAARGMVRPCPGYPDIMVVAAPLKLERGFVRAWTEPPDLGQHTDEYLGTSA